MAISSWSAVLFVSSTTRADFLLVTIVSPIVYAGEGVVSIRARHKHATLYGSGDHHSTGVLSIYNLYIIIVCVCSCVSLSIYNYNHCVCVCV